MRKRLLLFSVLIACAWAAFAQTDPGLGARIDANRQRGFAPEKLYQFGDLDSVNLFNGNLTLRLPIGGSYPVSSQLSYGISLYYNSQLWDSHVEQPGLCGTGYNGGDVSYPAGDPHHASNAGLGWRLSLGQIVLDGGESNPFRHVYISPDGARHPFTSYGFPPTDLTGAPAGTSFFYTNDLSHLRMKKLLYANGEAQYEVHFPDGIVHTFGDDGQIRSMADPFGNSVRISNAIVNGKWIWNLEDDYRLHQIVYRPWEPPANTYSFDSLEWVVETVSIRAFSSDSTIVNATYSFDYRDVPIKRGCANAVYAPCTTAVTVPLLSAITLPDDTSFSFTYNESTTDCYHSALLTRLTLPTGGWIDWEYGDYELPANGCATFGEATWQNAMVGVTKKTFKDASGSLGAWTYQPVLRSLTVLDDGRCGESTLPDHDYVPGQPYLIRHHGAEYLTNTVTDPLGRVTINYFATWNHSLPSGIAYGNQDYEYGLPFSRLVERVMAPTERSLSRYVCESGTGGSSQPACKPLRALFVAYANVPPQLRPEVRAQYERTYHYPTPQATPTTRYVDTSFSLADGFGHFRQTTAVASDGSIRDTYTDYNHNSNPDGTRSDGKIYFKAVDPWILNRYVSEEIYEDVEGISSRLKSEACFASTGVLMGRRQLKETTRSTKDVIVRYAYDAAGNAVTEDWYGGDNSPIVSDNLCDASTETSEYRLTHTYKSGVRETTKYRGFDYPFADATVDPDSGRIHRRATPPAWKRPSVTTRWVV